MDYVKLEDAAARAKKSEEALIEQGVAGLIGIYVVPNPAWRLRVIGTQKIDFSDGGEGGYVIDECLTGLPLSMLRLRLPTETLSAFVHYPDTASVDFFLFDSERADTTIIGLLPAMDAPLLVKDCSLVVRESELAGLRPPPPVRKPKRETPEAEAVPESVPTPPRKQRENPSLLSIKEVADKIGVSEGTIRNYMSEGSFPKSARYGRRTVRWKLEDVQGWIERHHTDEK